MQKSKRAPGSLPASFVLFIKVFFSCESFLCFSPCPQAFPQVWIWSLLFDLFNFLAFLFFQVLCCLCSSEFQRFSVFSVSPCLRLPRLAVGGRCSFGLRFREGVCEP